ncbi:MAG: tetratricopeptide repeat protein [Treponema sp.]|jgi:lipopolysaccharide biosynthesis regulator YciM|nr:tetratricopeptide repeat protein [Treponema sp.]
MLLPVVAGIAFLAVVAVAFVMLMGRSRGSITGRGKRAKGRDAVLKDANKKLAQNPRDPEALYAIADICFQEETWDKAMKNYEILMEICATSSNTGINEFEVDLRFALSALKLNLPDQAYRGFSAARIIRQDNFEVNYNLGYLEFQKKNYEKAIHLLQQARQQDPESSAALRYLGHAFFRIKKPREAMNFIRKAIDLAPDDKESLYTLAECYYEANQTEQAQRIFTHLRADPVMGPSACLLSGTINSDARQYEAAIQDFEIGLRHQDIKPDVLVELRYRLASAYLKKNAIDKALPLLKQIQLENSNYKDVNVLVGKYQELNANKNLQIFLMAPSADFVALCRKIVMNYFRKAKVKITNISVNKSEWADILAEVDTPKWADLIMFRFIRTQGSIGELIVRDFHSHLKEVKAGKGICVTVGTYTEEAKRYTEARLIDLIERDRLSAMLNAVDARPQAAAKK